MASRHFLLAATLLAATRSAKADWWVDQSIASAHLGGPRIAGPFATKAAALSYIAANINFAMKLVPNGFDRPPAVNSKEGNAAVNNGTGRGEQEAVLAQDEARKKAEADRKAAEEAAELVRLQDAKVEALSELDRPSDVVTSKSLSDAENAGPTHEVLLESDLDRTPTTGPHEKDTKAGDQLLSAASAAKHAGDLHVDVLGANFDQRSFAAYVGTLHIERPSTLSQAVQEEIAGFSEKVRSDKRIQDLVVSLAKLGAQRERLQSETDSLRQQRSAADAVSMPAINKEIEQKDSTYQALLQDISGKETSIKNLHKSIDTKEVSLPQPKNADNF